MRLVANTRENIPDKNSSETNNCMVWRPILSFGLIFCDFYLLAHLHIVEDDYASMATYAPTYCIGTYATTYYGGIWCEGGRRAGGYYTYSGVQHCNIRVIAKLGDILSYSKPYFYLFRTSERVIGTCFVRICIVSIEDNQEKNLSVRFGAILVWF